MKIYKYSLQICDSQIIQMKKGARIISLQVQNRIPCIWAMVDPNEVDEPKAFCTFGTGHDLSGVDLQFIGTYQLCSGELIYHVFESSI